MIKWLKSLLKTAERAGPPQELVSFRPPQQAIAQDAVTPEGDAWRVTCSSNQVVRLFEVQTPQVDQCMLTYRADLKTNDVQKRAYLEMWCRIPGQGEFFSKGFHHAVTGTNDWASFEVPFYLKRGQKPDLIKLNLTMEGSGTVWIKNVRVLRAPLQ